MVATDTHPFWVPELKKWVPAGDLEVGQWLRTSAGTHVPITAVRHYTKHQRTHDLTIQDVHAFYVLAEDTSILVHNRGATFGSTARSGRPDGQTVFAGHGGWSLRNDWTRVPEGTSLATYGPKGRSIGDFTGFRIEVGDTIAPMKIYGPGARVRNLQLYPPVNPPLVVHRRSITVTSQTPLSELLQPGMGMCHWAACQ
ncbi:HINT domain-containing protein [Streptomyces sp. NBC_00708]